MTDFFPLRGECPAVLANASRRSMSGEDRPARPRKPGRKKLTASGSTQTAAAGFKETSGGSTGLTKDMMASGRITVGIIR